MIGNRYRSESAAPTARLRGNKDTKSCEFKTKVRAEICFMFLLPVLTESDSLQLLYVDRQLQRCSLALTAPAGQRRGQAGGGGSQEWILQHNTDISSAMFSTFYRPALKCPARIQREDVADISSIVCFLFKELHVKL